MWHLHVHVCVDVCMCHHACRIHVLTYWEVGTPFAEVGGRDAGIT